jgi:UDP-glucose 4-epimerase
MASRTVLVAGGAGYIGSHTCLRLAEAGFQPVVIDSLVNGHGKLVQWGPLEVGDVRDGAYLDRVFQAWRPVGVIHFAALIEVGLSVPQIADFYSVNVGGTISLLGAMQRAGVAPLVFSSTCATYGIPQSVPFAEDHPQVPINPYGRTKLLAEMAIDDFARHAGIRACKLRYFNAAGADPLGRTGERHDPETHAIPLAIQTAMGRRSGFHVFGTDYPTRDGTCVRDYVHVLDLADAHVGALQHLLSGGAGEAFNLGTGTGTTVRELVAAVESAAGTSLGAQDGPRREGDPPALVADNARARTILGWQPRFSLDDCVRTAWAWHTRHEPALFG